MGKFNSQKIGFIILIILMLILVNFCVDNYLPSVPDISLALLTKLSNIQMAYALVTVGIGVGNLVSGIILLRKGRRKLILISFLICIIGLLNCAYSLNIAMFIASVIVTGFGIGILISSAIASICDVYHGEKLAKINAIIMLIIGLMPAISPTLGGVIDIFIGWKFNFIIPATLILSIYIVSLLYLPETFYPEKEHKSKNLATQTKEFFIPLKNFNYFLTIVCTVFCFGSLVAYNALGPALYEEVLHLTPIEYGSLSIFTAIAMVGSSLLNTFFIEKLGFKKIMLSGAAITFLANILLFCLFISGLFSVITVVVPVALFIFGINFVYVNTLPLSTVVYTKKVGNPATLFVFLESFLSSILGIVASHIPVSSQLYLCLMLSFSSIVVMSTMIYIFKHTS